MRFVELLTQPGDFDRIGNRKDDLETADHRMIPDPIPAASLDSPSKDRLRI
jgi:hypothetical protein